MISLLLAISALAGPNLEGKFTFDWLHPKTSRCHRVGASFAKKLQTYKCEPNDKDFGGEDKPAETRCTSPKGDLEYLLFGNMDDCKVARETSLSNGD